MALMTLGMFLFEIETLPFTEAARDTDWRFGQSERFGARKASQFLGPGDDKITLNGALYPGFVGKFTALQTIRDMADAGESYALLSGTGVVMGQWFIRKLSERTSTFFVDGVARKADFTIELERTDDAPVANTGAV